MPQSLVQSVTNTFVKGLITEAGPLTFPKDASVDELNCTLERDGSRRRRLGLEYEEDYELSPFTVTDSTLVNIGVWSNVAGQSGVNFLVLKNFNKLYFYELNGATISANLVTNSFASTTVYSVDLTSFAKPEGLGASVAEVEVTSINGRLIVVSSELNSFTIERDCDTGAFTTTLIDFKERDFEWLSQSEGNLYEATTDLTVSANRKFDTWNAGWNGDNGTAALATYTASESKYPPLTHPWYAGKDGSGSFDVNEWNSIYTGSSVTANGSLITGIFEKDRATATGIAGLATVTEEGRFSTVATYAGRVFYSGVESSCNGIGSRVYFSQIILSNFDDVGKCYQQNDPTSEEISDLLDTDGGFIFIPEANNIKKLHVFGPTLYVFADNGVWSISGVDDVFRASEYSVSKLTEVGLAHKGSFVSAEGRPYWWSVNGIHTLILNDQIGTIVEQNISQSTIQTFFKNIPFTYRSKVKAAYDGLNNRVLWMYSSGNGGSLDKFLFFDEVFKAFYPWSIEGDNEVLGAFYFPGVGSEDTVYTVVDSSGNTVVDSLGNTLTTTIRSKTYTSSALKFLIKDDATNKISFAEATSKDFEDFGESYSSYAVAGYDFFGDLTTFKNSPYVTVYLNRTEEGFVLVGSAYEAIRGSSCLVKAFWDFNTNPATSAQQAYRLKLPVIVNPSSLDTFTYPESVITTRLKVRGRGRSMKLRFESEAGKDFHLLGWEVIGAKNPTF